MEIIKSIEFKSKFNAIFIAIIIMSFIFSIAEAQNINIKDQEPINGDQKGEVEKDNWDKISAVSGLITGGLIALIIALSSDYYKKRELRIMRTNAILGFFEYLERNGSGMREAEDSGMREAALKAILYLDLDFGIELCKIFPYQGVNILNDLKIVSEKTHDCITYQKADDALKIILIPDDKEEDKEKVKKIKGSYENGESIEKISLNIREPRDSVRLKVNQLINEGKLEPRSSVRLKVPEPRSIDDPEITKKIIDLYNSGMGKSEIVSEMHLPLRAVRLKIEQLVKEGKLKPR